MIMRISHQRNTHWKTFAPSALPGSETFAAQSSLPKLPVPELSGTLSYLKESLKPIAWNEAEYRAVVSKIDEFGAGIGPELQKRLLKRQAETDHWLERWWDDGAYLGYRESVSNIIDCNMNSCFKQPSRSSLMCPTIVSLAL